MCACAGLDVRVAGAGLQGVVAHGGVGQRGEGAVRVEQAAPLQLPGLAPASAAAFRQGHYAPSEYCIQDTHIWTYIRQAVARLKILVARTKIKYSCFALQQNRFLLCVEEIYSAYIKKIYTFNNK